MLRVLRWRILLGPIAPLAFTQVGKALVVGYAVNNVLPARLGEIFRADFVWRHFGIRRSSVIWTIVVERLLDGIVVVGLFVVGLMLVAVRPGQSVLIGVAVSGVIGIAVGITIIFGILKFHGRVPLFRRPWLKPRIEMLAGALKVIHGPEILRASPLSFAIWALESAAYYFVIYACGVGFSVPELWVVVGAASLSTLIPSVPGFIGSFQLAFVLAFSALGAAPVTAIVAATLAQIVLLGSITLVGLLTLAVVSLMQARTANNPVE